MVSLELSEPFPNDPESRLPNASPEVVVIVVDAPPLVPRTGAAAVDDGVSERGLDEFELEAAASIEKASYFGRAGALLDDGVGLAPSLRGGCCDGFTGAEVFQRSAKESAMATDQAGLYRSYVFSLAFPEVSVMVSPNPGRLGSLLAGRQATTTHDHGHDQEILMRPCTRRPCHRLLISAPRGSTRLYASPSIVHEKPYYLTTPIFYPNSGTVTPPPILALY